MSRRQRTEPMILNANRSKHSIRPSLPFSKALLLFDSTFIKSIFSTNILATVAAIGMGFKGTKWGWGVLLRVKAVKRRLK